MSKRKKRTPKPNAAGLDAAKADAGGADPSPPDRLPRQANPPKRNLPLLAASTLLLALWMLFLLITALAG